MPISVVICSENTILRDLLADYLGRSDGMDVRGAGAAASTMALLCAQARVLLMDGGARDAVATMQRLLRVHAHLRAVVIGVDDAGGTVMRFARSGAASILPQDSSLDEVKTAIGRVDRKEVHCPAHVGDILMRDLAQSSEAASTVRIDKLTPREREVARCLQKGLSNKEIARLLRIETATTKNHMHNLLRKLGVDSRAKAAAALRECAVGDGQMPALSKV